MYMSIEYKIPRNSVFPSSSTSIHRRSLRSRNTSFTSLRSPSLIDLSAPVPSLYRLSNLPLCSHPCSLSFSRLVTTQASVLYHIFSSRVFRISSWKIEAIFDVTFTSYDFLPTHTQSEVTSLYLDVESTTTRSNSTGRHPTPID